MIRCIGNCSKCGKCKNFALMSNSNKIKASSLQMPSDFEADTNSEGYGIAFDIGTTTVVGMLWNLKSGSHIESMALANPQSKFGADVISRITYCGRDEEHLAELRQCICGCLNEIIANFINKHGFNNDDIMRICVCGNTTMSHLFAGYHVMSLALAPFTPAYEGKLTIKGSESWLNINEFAEVSVIPNIAGHVGGDIVSGLVSVRLLNKTKLTLYIDIGTNGEIVLVDGDKAFACSTAAGPAFEGAAIQCGMRAADGAIEKVLISEGNVYFRTIGDCQPTGICGSGIIDAAAQMLQNGIINSKGRMTGSKELILTDNIKITQKDIREIQLAKGAISSGTEILLKEAGREASELEEIIIAGAFGSYIDIDSAIKIGLLPAVKKDIIVCAGNAAGSGVSMAMMSEREMNAAIGIPNMVKHVELADRDDFMDIYMKSLLF